MSLTTVVKERIAEGEEAAADSYIHLVGNKDEAIELWEAYLSIQDDKYTPEEEPAELTEEQYQSYVRRIHDAVRSTDRAYDAFQTDMQGNNITQHDIQGNTIKRQTGMMNFLDSIRMFELQLIAGKLVTTIHNVQGGKLSIPAWPMLAGLGLHKYQTFPERMEAVIEILTLWKACCKDLFYTEMTWDKRLAMQPREEGNKKAYNAGLNLARKIQKEEAKRLKEDNKKKQGAALGTDEEDNDDEDDASNEAAPPPTKSAPKKGQRTKHGDFNTISSRNHLGKKVAAESSAEPAASADDAVQPVDPPAQMPTSIDGTNEAVIPAMSMAVNSGGSSQAAAYPAPALNNIGGSTQPFSNTAIKPINAPSVPAPRNTDGLREPIKSTTSASNNTGSPRQRAPSTPSPALKTGGSKQTNNVFAGPVMVNQDVQMKAAMAAASRGQAEFCDASKFAGPLEKPVAHFGDQGAQSAGPGSNDRPPAYTPGPYALPQQPQRAQSPGQYFPQRRQSSRNYLAYQPASYGLQQTRPQGHGLPQAHQRSQMQEGQRNTAQLPLHGQVAQHEQGSGVQSTGQAAHVNHVGQATIFQPSQPSNQAAGHQSNVWMPPFMQSDRVASIQEHGLMASIHNHDRTARIRMDGFSSCSIVNNYFHQPMLGSLDGETRPGSQEAISEHLHNDQYLDNDQTITYAKKLGDDEPEEEVDFDEWLHSDPDLYLPDDQTVGYRYPITSGDDQAEVKLQDSQNGDPTTPTTHQQTRSVAPTDMDDNGPPPQSESPPPGSRMTAEQGRSSGTHQGSLLSSSSARETEHSQFRVFQDSVEQSPLSHQAQQRNRNTSVYHGQDPSTQTGSPLARLDVQEPGAQRNRQMAGFQHGQTAGDTPAPTAPQVDQSSKANTAFSAANLPPWQSHLRGRNPTDIQAYLDCADASLGNPPGNRLGRRGADPAVLPSMFERYDDSWYEVSNERGMGTGEAEEYQSPRHLNAVDRLRLVAEISKKNEEKHLG